MILILNIFCLQIKLKVVKLFINCSLWKKKKIIYNYTRNKSNDYMLKFTILSLIRISRGKRLIRIKEIRIKEKRSNSNYRLKLAKSNNREKLKINQKILWKSDKKKTFEMSLNPFHIVKIRISERVCLRRDENLFELKKVSNYKIVLLESLNENWRWLRFCSNNRNSN